MLLQMQLLLSEDATDAYEGVHAATAAALPELQLPPPLSAQLQLHCSALHALHLLRRGRINELSTPGEAEATSVMLAVQRRQRKLRCCTGRSGRHAVVSKLTPLHLQHMAGIVH